MNSSSRSKGSPPKGSPLSSPTVLDKDNDSVKEKEMSDKDSSIRHSRSRRSADSKPSDRLSIFGATFGGSLGKTRKPPPRLDTIFYFCVLSHFRFLLLAKTLSVKEHRNSVFQDCIVPVYTNRRRYLLIVLLPLMDRLKRVLMISLCMTRRRKRRVPTPYENGVRILPLMVQQVPMPIHSKLRTVLRALSSRD